MKLVTILFVLLFLPLSYAGFSRGNGGHVIVCEKNGSKAYTLLDISEAKSRYQFPLKFSTEGDEYDRAQAIIDRLSTLNPTRHQQYRLWLKEFLQEVLFLKEMSIVATPDTGVSFIPKGCEVQQMIIQVEPHFPTEKRYTIDYSIWQHLDVDNRAAAIVHEIIYREAISIENQHTNSEYTRMLNGFIHSTLIEATTLKEWLLLNQNLGFHQADAHGISIKLNFFEDETYSRKLKSTLIFFDNHHVQLAELPYNFNFRLNNEPYSNQCKEDLAGKSFSSMVTFYPNGKIQEINFNKSSKDCLGIKLNLTEGADLTLNAVINKIKFNSSHEISELTFESSEFWWPELNFPPVIINGPKVKIERHFNPHLTPYFTILFSGNRPALLINNEYLDSNSKTMIKTESGWQPIPNKDRQEIL